MSERLSNTLLKLLSHGTVHRERVKNEWPAILRLCRRGFVQKTYRRGKVFYELTPKSLPLLEHGRRMLLEQAQLEAAVSRSPFYNALLNDVRFMDETSPLAKRFMLLGDWQLTKPVVPSQLELSKLRYYHHLGLA